MIRFYFKNNDLWGSIGNPYDGDLFSDEFLEWCDDRNVFFKSTMHGSNEDVEIHIKDLTMRSYNKTNSFNDSLVMYEETAILFKLTWL